MGSTLNTRNLYSDIYDGLEMSSIYKRQAEDAFTYFSTNAQNYKNQFLFWMLNEQWDGYTLNARKLANKPTLNLNLGYSIINEVLGEDRNATPGLVIRSTDERYEKSAEIIDGIIRQIMYESRFDVLRQIVLRSTMVGGFGVFEVKKEYESFDSFEQTLRIYADSDAISYYFDPCAKDPDKGDGDYCGRIYDLSIPYYRKLFPRAKSDTSFQIPPELSMKPDTYQTQGKKRIFIARHVIKEYFNRKLAKLSDGSFVDEKNWEKEVEDRKMQQYMDYHNGLSREIMDIKVEQVEERMDYKIVERYLNGEEELDKTLWQSRYFPLTFVDGDSSIYEGQQYTKGFMDFAQSQQQLLNYVSSEIAVYLVSAKKAKVMGTPVNFEGHEQEWDDNNVERTRLTYNYDPITQSPPIPLDMPPFPESLIPLMQSIQVNIRNVAARNTSNDGSGTQNRSGTAEKTRINQGNQPSNVYIDNVNRGMESVGRCLASLIPSTYDTTREVTLRAKNNKSVRMKINEPSEGNTYINEVKMEQISLVVEVGGSFAQQREENNNTLLQLAAVNPKANEVLPDLIAQNSDLPNKEEVVERMQMILPPDVRQKVLKEPPEPPPPNPLMALEQQKMNLEQQKINNQTMELKIKEIEQQNMQMKMALEEKNMLLQHQATIAKTDAESYKAEKQVEQAAMTHHAKLREFDSENEIHQLYKENEELKRALSMSLGIAIDPMAGSNQG